MRKTRRIIALSISLIMLTTTVLFASPMKDVSTSHWAYNDITKMQKLGFLAPSSKGEFFPNNYVTYFEFSKVLAKATGYEDASLNPNIDPVLKKQIEDNYALQKPVIEAHQNNYKHWQKDANQEIAYLLGRGYLQKEDLGRFMSQSTSGLESRRGVRKQQAAVYLVRMLHIEETAKAEYKTTGFKDEGEINAAARPHVAFLVKKDVVSGDLDGNFKPTEPITRAILSKMLIRTLEIKEELDKPETPIEPEQEEQIVVPGQPTDKGLEGQLTKMISKGDNGYYIVLEVEPGKMHTYSIESTASIADNKGIPLSLQALKGRIDAEDGKNVNVTAKINLIGTTEYMTEVRLMDSIEDTSLPTEDQPVVDQAIIDKPVVDQGQDPVVTDLTGTIYSILLAPTPEITIQLIDGRKTYLLTPNSELYSNLARRGISVWDLRLNQRVELEAANREIKRLEVTRAAPPVTLTGTIIRTSINGEQIDLRVPYDSATGQTDLVRTINVPMKTQITDGTIQRGRKDLNDNMQIVVVFGENGSLEPEQIVILAK